MLLSIGCTYDDSELAEQLTEINDRIERLQGRIEALNTQLADLEEITNGNVITSVDVDDNGNYIITYKNIENEEKTIVIATKEQMLNVPYIGVRKDEENGLYYWTLTSDGVTDYLLDDNGEKIPVSGKTPEVSVDSEGYWTVLGQRLTDTNGNPIKANDGTTSVFKQVSTDENGNLVIVLGNGEKLTLPIQNVFNLTLTASNVNVEDVNSTKELEFEIIGSEDAIVSLADVNAVTAELDKEHKKVIVSFDQNFVKGHIILVAYDMVGHTVLRPVFFEKTSSQEIRISNKKELLTFAEKVNSSSETDKINAVLTNDIDMSGTANWIPIGNGSFSIIENKIVLSGASFKGKFNGNNHTIKNLSMDNNNSSSPYGFFGIVGNGAVIENINFDSSSSLTVSSNSNYVGVLAGVVTGATIREIVSKANINVSNVTTSNIAMVGSAYSDGDLIMFERIQNDGNIVTTNNITQTKTVTEGYLAGIVAEINSLNGISSSTTISECINNGKISLSSLNAGGIVGKIVSDANLENCTSNGDVTSTSDEFYIGGIVSTIEDGDNVYFSNCVNYANVSTKGAVGGIVALPSNTKFSSCANYGDIISDSDSRGIFCALFNENDSKWSNCIAAGNVGKQSDNKIIYDTYSDSEKNKYLGPVSSSVTIDISGVEYNIGEKKPGGDSGDAELKVLFIGNSFTKDAVEHLPGMLKAAGLDKVLLTHMYYGGRTVPEYWQGFETKSDYHCYKCSPGASVWIDELGHTISDIASSEQWDIVTIQEHTGRAEAWYWTDDEKNAIQGLIDKIKDKQLGAGPKFYYIMSQAYFDMNKIGTAQRPYINFETQDEMYQVIVEQAKKVMNETTFDGIIPTGTVLQNLRTTYLDNDFNLTRDGYHMDYGISRYSAACAVFETIISPAFNNILLDNNSYRYSESNTSAGSYTTPVTDGNAPVALEAARNAMKNPYLVTDMSDAEEFLPDNGIEDIESEEGNKE